MVYTHHSHTKCEDCGTRHIPGNTEACIETLKDRITELEEGLKRIIHTPVKNAAALAREVLSA